VDTLANEKEVYLQEARDVLKSSDIEVNIEEFLNENGELDMDKILSSSLGGMSVIVEEYEREKSEF
jgi:hypothetical protein